MKISTLSCLLALLMVSFCFQSNANDDTFKFGKVPAEFVHMKVYEPDPEAKAVVLLHTGEAKIVYTASHGFVIQYKFHKVIKVLNKEGVSYADLQIPYYNIQNRIDRVGQIKGFVYNEDGGKIRQDKIGKDNIFDEAVTDFYKLKKISFPNVVEGSVFELSYEIESDLFNYMREWEFKTDIPTRWSEYFLEYPEYFNFSQSNQGYESYVFNTKKNGSGTATWTDKERTNAGYNVSSSYSNNAVTYGTEQFHWAVRNAAALRPEPFIDNPMSYATKVEFQLQSIQFPNAIRQNIAASWEKISEDLLKDEDFGKHLTKNKAFKPMVEALVGGLESQEEKMLKIYEHISNTVKWDGTRGIYPTRSLEKSYNEGKGSVADINFLLIVFLREAGINADPIVSSTRDKGFLNPANPVMYKLNYISALVNYEDKEVVIDVTDSTLPLGFLPVRMINFRGWAVGDYGLSRWVEFNNSTPNSETAIYNTSFSDGNITTSVQRNSNGYESASVKGLIASGQDKYMNWLKANNKDFEISAVTYENADSKYKGLVEKFELKGGSGFEETGEYIYFNPFEKFELSENPFKYESRVFPIDFIYNQKKQYILTVEVPEGYVIDEMPKGFMSQFNEKMMVYAYRVAMNGDKLQIMVNFQINQPLFKADEYTEIRTFFDGIAEKQKESIVFKKI